MANANASAEFLYLIHQWIKRFHPDATLQMGVFKFDTENPHGIVYLIENNEQTKIETDFDALSEWHSYESDLGKDMDF